MTWQPWLSVADARCVSSVKVRRAAAVAAQTHMNPVDWLSTRVGTLAGSGSGFDSSCRGPEQDRLWRGLLLRASSSCLLLHRCRLTAAVATIAVAAAAALSSASLAVVAVAAVAASALSAALSSASVAAVAVAASALSQRRRAKRWRRASA